MAQRTVDIRLGTKYNGSGIAAFKKGLASVGRNLVNFQAGFSMAASAIGKLGSIFSGAFKFETQTAQFKTLIGDIDEARAHMADLKALGDTPPFSLDDFAAASRSLMVMTDGALGYKKSLEMIGDAAAATGRPVEEMGQAVGRLYAFIRDGQPISRAVTQLRNMGVITPEVAQRLQDMQEAGASSVEIWSEVEAQLARYNGAMKETEQTGEGLMGAIKSRWENFVRQFGEAFSDAAKDGMGKMLSKMEELEKSGTIEDWAEGAVESLEKVAESARGVVSLLGSIAGGAWKTVKGSLGTAWAFAAGADEKFREQSGWGKLNLWQQIKSGGRVAREYWNREVLGEIPEEEVAQERGARKARSERRAELRRKRDSEEEERKVTALKAADEKRAADAQIKAADAQIKAAEDRKKAEEAAAKAWADAMAKYEEALHKKRMDDIRAEIDDAQFAASQKRSVASAAQSEFDRAFAMYRDPEKAAAQIADERDYAADLQRLHRDARRYGGKWRIDELSQLMSAGDTQGVTESLERWRKSKGFTPQVEAMVRASAAEQTKTTAEDELRRLNDKTERLSQTLEQMSSERNGKLDEIEKNTNQLANKLDELLTVKG